jgi:leucyl-tRNA synthetase
VKQIVTLIHRLPPQLVEQILNMPIDEAAVFEAAKAFLEKEFKVPVRVLPAEEGGHAKAESALPFKPAIVIE